MVKIGYIHVDMEYTSPANGVRWIFTEEPPENAETYNAATRTFRPAEVKAIAYSEQPFAPEVPR